MKKIFTLIAMAALAISAQAQVSATVKWNVTDNDGKAVVETNIAPADAAKAVEPTVGEGLGILEAPFTWNGITFLQLQPTVSDKGTNKYASVSDLKKYIDFKITAQEFTVKEVSFDMIKRGTGDPNIYIAILDNDGNQTLIAGGDEKTESTATVIRRNNDDDATSINQKFEANATVAEGNAFTLRIYVGKLANNKQVGIANVVISGTVPTSTGIQSVKALQQSNVRYNLAGQQVDENYKGVVIVNGQKLIQK